MLLIDFFCNIFIKCCMCMLLKVDINNIFLRILSFSVIKAQFYCSVTKSILVTRKVYAKSILVMTKEWFVTNCNIIIRTFSHNK